MPHKKEPIFGRDNPEWTSKDFARANKHSGGLSLKDLGNTIARKRGRPKLESPKEAIKLRIDADILASYRELGAGWQTKINNDLRKARKLKAS